MVCRSTKVRRTQAGSPWISWMRWSHSRGCGCQMVGDTSSGADLTRRAGLRKQSIPSARIRRNESIARRDRNVDRRRHASYVSLGGRENVLVHKMRYTLTDIDTTGRITETKIATPEVVCVVELQLEISMVRG